MIVDFEDKLEDGTPVFFEALEFESDDPSVGYGGAVTNWNCTSMDTSLAVELTAEDEARLTNKAFEIWHQSMSYEDPYDLP